MKSANKRSVFLSIPFGTLVPRRALLVVFGGRPERRREGHGRADVVREALSRRCGRRTRRALDPQYPSERMRAFGVVLLVAAASIAGAEEASIAGAEEASIAGAEEATLRGSLGAQLRRNKCPAQQSWFYCKPCPTQCGSPAGSTLCIEGCFSGCSCPAGSWVTGKPNSMCYIDMSCRLPATGTRRGN